MQPRVQTSPYTASQASRRGRSRFPVTKHCHGCQAGLVSLEHLREKACLMALASDEAGQGNLSPQCRSKGKECKNSKHDHSREFLLHCRTLSRGTHVTPCSIPRCLSPRLDLACRFIQCGPCSSSGAEKASLTLRVPGAGAMAGVTPSVSIGWTIQHSMVG